MKIAIVVPYYKPSIGGVQNYVEDLVQAYRDDDIVIITTRLNRQQPFVESINGIKVYRLPVLVKISNTPFHPTWKYQMKKIFRAEHPDVITAHAPVPWFGDIAQRAAGKTPFVFTYHAGSMKKGSYISDTFISIYEKFILPRTLRSASRIIAVYPDFIRRIMGNSRHIIHIPPGIDTSFFTPQKKQPRYDLLFAGRLEKTSAWKGIDTALKAVAELKHENITLCIAGDGDAKQQYINMSKELGIDHLVTFTGSLDRQQMRDLYRISKLILLPSYTESESFGMVVAEAASCGVPAIGSNIGGIPYVIDNEKTGLLAKPKDHLSFAHAISKILSDEPRRKKYGTAARKRTEALFSLDQMQKNTRLVLHEATASPYPKNLQIVAYYPPALGGMERVAENIAIELAESRQSVEVVTSTIGYSHTFKDYQHEGYTVTRLRGFMATGLPVIPMIFWHLLKQPAHSLYHVHVAQAFIPELALLAAWLRRGKFIAHFHLDVAPSGTFGKLFVLYKKTLFPFMLRCADRVIVFSDDQKQLVHDKYGVDQNRIRILPNGIRRGFERHTARTLHRPHRILFVGRLSQQKNIGFLLEALKDADDFSTRIVGDGELRAQLQDRAAKLGLKNIVFVGRKDDDELLKEYDDADIFVLPSEREGMPLVLIDAMAMRLPAIGANVLGTRDMIDNNVNGLLVPLNDVDSLKNALRQITSSSETYAKMSQQAYESVRELAWPQLVKRIINEVYS